MYSRLQKVLGETALPWLQEVRQEGVRLCMSEQRLEIAAVHKTRCLDRGFAEQQTTGSFQKQSTDQLGRLSGISPISWHSLVSQGHAVVAARNSIVEAEVGHEATTLPIPPSPGWYRSDSLVPASCNVVDPCKEIKGPLHFHHSPVWTKLPPGPAQETLPATIILTITYRQ